MFAFKLASLIFFAFAVVTSKYHNSTPDSVVLVKAINFSLGDQEILVIFGLLGNPIT